MRDLLRKAYIETGLRISNNVTARAHRPAGWNWLLSAAIDVFLPWGAYMVVDYSLPRIITGMECLVPSFSTLQTLTPRI